MTSRIGSGARIEAFLEMMAAERGASDNTLASYRRDLEDAAQHVAAKGQALQDAGADDLRDFLTALSAQGFAATTQTRKLSALRQFAASAAPAALRIVVAGASHEHHRPPDHARAHHARERDEDTAIDSH